MPGVAMGAKQKSPILQKAASLLARRAYSRGELRKKLELAAAEPELEAALNRLEQLKLLNDDDYAYNFAFCRIRQEGWGPAKVRNALRQRQIDPATADSVLERIQIEIGEESALETYICKYLGKRKTPCNPRETRRLISHLQQRGFSREPIMRAVRRLIPDIDLTRFEQESE
jgi:regulatory protein